jgi:hypothetical protein
MWDEHVHHELWEFSHDSTEEAIEKRLKPPKDKVFVLKRRLR